MASNVLISGGTGLVGKALQDFLREKGFNVAYLSRKKDENNPSSYYWDYTKGIIEDEAIEFADILIHLAGENISSKRWTNRQKEIIINSRVKSTELLFQKVKSASKKPRLIISASAVGYYGVQKTDKTYREEDDAGKDFLATTVKKWENSVLQFETLGIQTVRLRIGVVLSKNGGFLSSISTPVKLGVGSAVGSGNQVIPWIEISDLVGIVYYVINKENPAQVYNAVAPEVIDNRSMMKTLATSLNKPFFFPAVPSFIIKLLFGEMSDIILLGNKVSSSKIQFDGYRFNYENVKDVFDDYFPKN